MRRTTLALDEKVLRQLKEIAAREGKTLQAVANDLLRQVLSRPQRKPFRLRLQGWDAQQQPGVDILDRDKLFDVMEGR